MIFKARPLGLIRPSATYHRPVEVGMTALLAVDQHKNHRMPNVPILETPAISDNCQALCVGHGFCTTLKPESQTRSYLANATRALLGGGCAYEPTMARQLLCQIVRQSLVIQEM